MKKGTVKDIQNYTKSHYGYIAKSCWIADVKFQCGIPVRQAWNRKSPNKREVPCPKEKVEQIKTALKELNWL